MKTKENLQNAQANTQEQYLLFLAGGELYAMEALKAQEIVEYSSVTKIPMMNNFVKGVTNIRGNIVPVIDLMGRFQLNETIIGKKTSVVVVNYIDNDNNRFQIGVIIDEVYEVDNILNKDLRAVAGFGSKIDAKFIRNMGKYKNEYIPIINTQTILNINELSKLKEAI